MAHWDWRNSPGQISALQDPDIAKAKQFLDLHHVRYVLAQFVDVYGVGKSKSVPEDHLEDIVTGGVGLARGGVFGMRLAPHEAEYMIVGELSTLTLTPWAPGYARMLGTGTASGRPHPIDTRNILKARVARMAEMGWTFNTGIEPECSLFERTSNGSIVPFGSAGVLQKPAYDYRGLSRAGVFLERVTVSLQALGIDVYQIDHEDGNGPYEINFKYAVALTFADQIILFRMAAVESAHELGAICSFMPMPSSSTTGNGMHIYCSIANASGRNIFRDPNDRRGMGLASLAYHFLGGILAHAASSIRANLTTSISMRFRSRRSPPASQPGTGRFRRSHRGGGGNGKGSLGWNQLDPGSWYLSVRPHTVPLTTGSESSRSFFWGGRCEGARYSP